MEIDSLLESINQKEVKWQKVLRNTRYIALILTKLKDHALLLEFLCEFEQIFSGSFENKSSVKQVMPAEFTQFCESIVKEAARNIASD